MLIDEPSFKPTAGEFVGPIVDSLTEQGVIAAVSPSEAPFTDRTPQAPDALLKSPELDELPRVLETVRATAVAA